MSDRDRSITPSAIDRGAFGELREIRRDVSQIRAELAAARVERSSLHDAFAQMGLDLRACEAKISGLESQVSALAAVPPSIDKLGSHIENLRASVDGLQKWRTGMVYAGLAIFGACSVVSTLAALLVQFLVK